MTGDTLSGPMVIAARTGGSDAIVLEKPFTPLDVQNAIRLATQGNKDTVSGP
jgi:hypothetical protein